MSAFKWMLASAVLAISAPLFAGESNRVIVSYFEPLQRLSFQSDGIETSQKLRGAVPGTLSFDALGRSFDLQLEPNNGLLSTASRNALPDGVEIYRGRLAGNPDSWARIVVFDGMPRGLVWDGQQMFAIEAPGDTRKPRGRVSTRRSRTQARHRGPRPARKHRRLNPNRSTQPNPTQPIKISPSNWRRC